MKRVKNMNGVHRVFYVLVGITLLAWPFVTGSQGWGRLGFLLLGVVSLISGGSGW